tara:strand:- start:1075 stop:1335 length:261 start_codon:yes stop_codon:yes gene_type:complete
MRNYKELHKGIVSNSDDAERIILEIENQIEAYAEDGLEDCPNVEDLSVTLDDLQTAVKNKSFPITLEFVNFGRDLYESVIENIEMD